ncbi:cell division protein FtsK [Intrasporangium chromatireducens Q5-1]|uniref:Cell division protein FtsK n=1 Tax=Intrasporangium chromatireducens Q5-1 TaxID=584657 RepID=W9GPB8_9MICO|nr:FtsK/SpoIIIE domain-containing protein [Intrasporangium chromatireducens]EWT06663.1 cell division protein FtsK [Intrasporangium chromatireducens Q5-1]
MTAALVPAGSTAWTPTRRALRLGWALVSGVLSWSWRHTRWVLLVAALAFLTRLLPDGPVLAEWLLLLGWVAPALVATVWVTFWPVSYRRSVAGPAARVRWVCWARRRWPHLARECGLSVNREQTPTRSARLVGALTTGPAPALPKVWVHPRLCSATARGVTLTLTVRARTGQTVDDLEAVAPALAAAAGARSFRCRAVSPSMIEYDLVMSDRLTAVREATAPTDVRVDAVPLGRRQDDTAWVLPVTGRHTLVVGCSGSGKGSIFWGVCAGLAPAVRAGLVCLWGIDLKRGVEIGMGRHLFHRVATTPSEALDVLAALRVVIDQRGHRMAGHSRLHTPTPSDPLHVVAIDELAVLTAYTDPEIRKEASRLLAEILTQGRALGVVVLACVQDPRKEVIGLRGLFTQTIALRLRSAEETRMVLGDGTADLAPAHRISPATPGVAWVIDEDGTADRVRADYWPDRLVREVATHHPAPALHAHDIGSATLEMEEASNSEGQASAVASASPRARKPRSPRKPRQPRQPRPAPFNGGSSRSGGEAA